MNSTFAKILVVALFVATATSQVLEVVDPEIRLSPGSEDGNLGIVYGARSCGGPGRFEHWHIEGCDSKDSICRLPADENVRQSEIEFVPSADIEQLGIRVIYKCKGEESQTVVDKALENSSVTAGVEKALKLRVRIPKKMQGKTITVQQVLYRVDTGATEICSEADFELV